MLYVIRIFIYGARKNPSTGDTSRKGKILLCIFKFHPVRIQKIKSKITIEKKIIGIVFFFFIRV